MRTCPLRGHVRLFTCDHGHAGCSAHMLRAPAARWTLCKGVCGLWKAFYKPSNNIDLCCFRTARVLKLISDLGKRKWNEVADTPAKRHVICKDPNTGRVRAFMPATLTKWPHGKCTGIPRMFHHVSDSPSHDPVLSGSCMQYAALRWMIIHAIFGGSIIPILYATRSGPTKKSAYSWLLTTDAVKDGLRSRGAWMAGTRAVLPCAHAYTLSLVPG